ncbi:MAG: hypothetical protein KAQ85_03130, partial [Thermodesulfovibrionia bacterium]|nr:hypothetical protein [Thermodesulfovibrionia bacterium]
RTKYFSLKELRISIAHMVLWSLLVVAIFTYLAMELGDKIERGLFYFLIVFFGYAIIVVILPMFFTHRFLGPFERLKTELRIILSGDYHRRLSVRSKDDYYIRSFLVEIDKVLDELEKMYLFKKEICEKIDSELSEIKSLLEKKEISEEELRGAVLSFHKKVAGLLEGDRTRR